MYIFMHTSKSGVVIIVIAAILRGKEQNLTMHQ